LKETFEGTAARTTVQPDEDFIARSWIFRWEEPEEQLRCICGVGDGENTGVRLANVKWDEWDGAAVDRKC